MRPQPQWTRCACQLAFMLACPLPGALSPLCSHDRLLLIFAVSPSKFLLPRKPPCFPHAARIPCPLPFVFFTVEFSLLPGTTCVLLPTLYPQHLVLQNSTGLPQLNRQVAWSFSSPFPPRARLISSCLRLLASLPKWDRGKQQAKSAGS